MRQSSLSNLKSRIIFESGNLLPEWSCCLSSWKDENTMDNTTQKRMFMSLSSENWNWASLTGLLNCRYQWGTFPVQLSTLLCFCRQIVFVWHLDLSVLRLWFFGEKNWARACLTVNRSRLEPQLEGNAQGNSTGRFVGVGSFSVFVSNFSHFFKFVFSFLWHFG